MSNQRCLSIPATAILLRIAILALVSVPASAQTITATITGSVTDPAGAVVPNATVTATVVATGQAKTAATDGEGRYTIPFLPPGEYNVTVEGQGFSKTTRNRVTLEVAQTATLDFKLTVGAATDVVEISGDAPLLQTEQSGLETTVENKLIEDLPSAQRSALAFINNVPGVIDAGFALAQGESLNVNGNAQGPIGSPGNRNFFDSSFSVGGGQNSTNDVLLDGVSNTVGDFNGVAVNPPPDSVREFKVLSGVYSAEYGRSGGGVVNMVTKAGAKQFQGALYEYFQNGGLNANGWQRNRRGQLANGTDVLPRIPIKRNQFGAAIGGPIWLPKKIFGPAGYDNPNKTFFFFNHEGRRERNPFSRELTLPTSKMRRGDFSELLTGATRAGQTDVDGTASLFGQLYNPYGTLVGAKRQAFAGNRLDTLPTCGPGPRASACLDPVALEILKYIPLPNQPGLANNYVVSDIAKFKRDLFAIRVDQTVSDKHSFFGRYSREARNQAEPTFLGTVATNSRVIQDDFHNFTFNDVYALKPTLINNARYGYTRARAHQTPVSEGFDPGTLGFPSYILNTSPIGAFPILSFEAGAQGQGRPSEITGGQIGGSGNNQPRDTQTVAESLTWIKGAHTLKFGGEYRLLRFFAFQFNNPAGTYTFARSQTRGPISTATPANVLETGSSFASFLLGIPSGGSKEQVTPITIYHHYYAGFIQNDWKPSRSLTLNLGLRWDYETGTGETHGLISNFDPDAASHLKGRVGAPADPIVGALRPNFMDLRGLIAFPDGPQTDYPKKRFAPRVGLAYRLGEKTVLRGGYGVFFVPYSVEQTSAIGNVFSVNAPQSFDSGQVRQPGGAAAPTVFLNNPYPNGITAPPGNSLGPDTLIGQSPVLVEPFRQNAYVQQWNVVVSRQLARNLALDVAYAGNHGVRLPYRTLNINQIPSEYLDYAKANFASARDANGVAATNVSQFFSQSVANPFFGLITNPNSTLGAANVTRGQLLKRYPQYDNPTIFNGHFGASKYNSLQVKLEKRFSQGLSANVSYVWSKTIDIGRNGNNNSGAATSIDDAFDLAGEYSISNFDIPHRFVGSFSYELPFGRRKAFGGDWSGLLQALAGGWQVSGTFTRQAGSPISIVSNGFGLSFATRRPDRLPGDASFGDARERARDGDTWFDTALFAQPADFTLGNAARNFSDVRRDGYRNVDLSVLKNFFFAEGRQKIQFRGEFINAFNLVVYGTPGSNVSDPANFGRITTQGNQPRLIQLALRYTF
jgi:outer membrane receptor protein involved in Fe transport